MLDDTGPDDDDLEDDDQDNDQSVKRYNSDQGGDPAPESRNQGRAVGDTQHNPTTIDELKAICSPKDADPQISLSNIATYTLKEGGHANSRVYIVDSGMDSSHPVSSCAEY